MYYGPSPQSRSRQAFENIFGLGDALLAVTASPRTVLETGTGADAGVAVDVGLEGLVGLQGVGDLLLVDAEQLGHVAEEAIHDDAEAGLGLVVDALLLVVGQDLEAFAPEFERLGTLGRIVLGVVRRLRPEVLERDLDGVGLGALTDVDLDDGLAAVNDHDVVVTLRRPLALRTLTGVGVRAAQIR